MFINTFSDSFPMEGEKNKRSSTLSFSKCPWVKGEKDVVCL